MTEKTTTDDLIAKLSAEPAPAPTASPEAMLLRRMALGFGGTLVLFFTLLGPRPQLGLAMTDPVVLAKTALPFVLALLALPLALNAARPAAPRGWQAQAIWVLPMAALSLFMLAYATHAPADRLRLFVGHSIPVCMPAIVTLSLPVTAALISILRRGAPLNPPVCGALAGLVAGGLATTVYSTFCTEDSPLFYSVWYSLGIAMAAGVGAWAGRRWLTW
ncbi:NrsF family protein [Pseudooceanicola nanhaiensis]|uniref:NrsF family protein n=1 Tax=Pseudooceanicola nanhaiensis TaxID=375761 RepID=UPI001CD40607|nr:DUF1109 domain-containing protein [Pseudooceanicola nanhaiensis]MCA0922432.1 DUF1109 domain-containing protein [Pseudooceanicola nanhaiensis]